MVVFLFISNMEMIIFYNCVCYTLRVNDILDEAENINLVLSSFFIKTLIIPVLEKKTHQVILKFNEFVRLRLLTFLELSIPDFIYII